jgi:hypothetical protein
MLYETTAMEVLRKKARQKEALDFPPAPTRGSDAHPSGFPGLSTMELLFLYALKSTAHYYSISIPPQTYYKRQAL